LGLFPPINAVTGLERLNVGKRYPQPFADTDGRQSAIAAKPAATFDMKSEPLVKLTG